MSTFFDALQNFKPKERQKPIVTIQGKTIEVESTLFQEILQHGEDQYEIKNNKIVRKPLPKYRKIYGVLTKSEKGFTLVDSDPYWPDGIAEGGYTWQTESE